MLNASKTPLEKVVNSFTITNVRYMRCQRCSEQMQVFMYNDEILSCSNCKNICRKEVEKPKTKSYGCWFILAGVVIFFTVVEILSWVFDIPNLMNIIIFTLGMTFLWGWYIKNIYIAYKEGGADEAKTTAGRLFLFIWFGTGMLVGWVLLACPYND